MSTRRAADRGSRAGFPQCAGTNTHHKGAALASVPVDSDAAHHVHNPFLVMAMPGRCPRFYPPSVMLAGKESDVGHEICGHAHASVGKGEAELAPAGWRQGNSSRVRVMLPPSGVKLDGVGQDVDKDLLEAQRV